MVFNVSVVIVIKVVFVVVDIIKGWVCHEGKQ